jgi:hypothetical protein
MSYSGRLSQGLFIFDWIFASHNLDEGQEAFKKIQSNYVHHIKQFIKLPMAQTNATDNFILQRLDDGLTAVNEQMFVLL